MNWELAGRSFECRADQALEGVELLTKLHERCRVRAATPAALRRIGGRRPRVGRLAARGTRPRRGHRRRLKARPLSLPVELLDAPVGLRLALLEPLLQVALGRLREGELVLCERKSARQLVVLRPEPRRLLLRATRGARVGARRLHRAGCAGRLHHPFVLLPHAHAALRQLLLELARSQRRGRDKLLEHAARHLGERGGLAELREHPRQLLLELHPLPVHHRERRLARAEARRRLLELLLCILELATSLLQGCLQVEVLPLEHRRI